MLLSSMVLLTCAFASRTHRPDCTVFFFKFHRHRPTSNSDKVATQHASHSGASDLCSNRRSAEKRYGGDLNHAYVKILSTTRRSTPSTVREGTPSRTDGPATKHSQCKTSALREAFSNNTMHTTEMIYVHYATPSALQRSTPEITLHEHKKRAKSNMQRRALSREALRK